jgi:hypothetical protein
MGKMSKLTKQIKKQEQGGVSGGQDTVPGKDPCDKGIDPA